MVDVHQQPRTLYRPDINLDPWLMTEDDLPWLHFLFKKKYDSRFDAVTTENWYRNVVLKAPLMFYPVRLQNSFLIGMLSCVPWLPNDFDCHVACLCADDGAGWEVLRLLRGSIAWARTRKCKHWMINSDTEYDVSPLARRLGAN